MKRLQSKHRNIYLKATTYHGVSLIEMLVMISLISVIFTVGVTMLAFLMRVEMQGTARIRSSMNLQRLSKNFREDVAAARKASILSKENPKLQKLKLDLKDDIFIVYSAGENDNGKFIVREKNNSTQLISRNEYLISESQFQFSIENINQRQIASLRLKFPPDGSHENNTIKVPFRKLDFDAAINQKYAYVIKAKE